MKDEGLSSIIEFCTWIICLLTCYFQNLYVLPKLKSEKYIKNERYTINMYQNQIYLKHC